MSVPCAPWLWHASVCRTDARRSRLERVEAIAWERVVQLVHDPAVLQRATEQARGSEDQAQIELESQQQSLQEAEVTIARLIDLLGNAASPSVQRSVQKKLNELTKHCEPSRARIAELGSRLAERGRLHLGCGSCSSSAR